MGTTAKPAPKSIKELDQVALEKNYSEENSGESLDQVSSSKPSYIAPVKIRMVMSTSDFNLVLLSSKKD